MIELSDDALSFYNSLKLESAYFGGILRIEQESHVVVDTILPNGSTYADFRRTMEDCPHEPRYAVIRDLKNKIAFISWLPDKAATRSKMLYASNKESLKAALVGIEVDITATTYDELSYDAIMERHFR